MSAVLTWILTYLLNWLLGQATALAASHFAEVELDKKRDIINDENVKRYEAAQSRADRIRAATDLLNGNKR